ncbi:MAG: sensor histidine kinase [Candidatus Accumulibacter phosphatis]|jgi:signal transduction histidine kinase|uniref:histidine kinase n=1 Tax=Candidatus Accumulibacter contiguus TaxID=2954381 RepID=A0ABX1TDM0_9PROT|nr:sensor histidine kinase [Candidatus Accumulibacter contiguus]NMQ06581.1 ATP-binding protein [Candidatus Accumulibacter contiguus]
MNMVAPRSSLRIRLLAGTLVWITASIIVAGWGLRSLFQQHVEAQFHAELKTHLDQLTAQLTLDSRGHASLALPLSDPRLSRPYSGCYWQIDQTHDGMPPETGVLRSRSLWDHVLATPPDTPADGEIHQHRIIGPEGKMLGMVERSVRIDDTPDGKSRSFRLIAAADESLMTEPVSRFSGALWLALGVLGGGLVIAALVQVFIGLAPLRKLHTALGKVQSGEMQHLDGDFPAEIMPLVDQFNAVLVQNAEVVERARTQAGNLAHALKTPLSVLSNAALAPDARDSALSRLVIDQVGTARRQLDYHLARAQAAATALIPGTRTPLSPIIDGLVRTMRHIHADRQLALTVMPVSPSLAFRGEPQDLQEMLGNLLDNACKWAAHQVEISARCEGGNLRILIDDDGTGLAAEQREAVIQRGVRADEQVPGSGLGLAIVDDLARLYGGRVELADSPLGGLRAVLILPVAQ